MDSYQFDDFDEHPVIGGGSKQMEKWRGKYKIVLGVSPSQLA